ncbi:hypothetical protein [Spirillospora albida]|uniref:hypothetical protein n=1 Tax=Spirillospora albida TaxID=58123 RepID=UPI00069256B5|nr:hypothetical protein [Spirillospora albida]
MGSLPVHRSILVLDLEKSTGMHRTNPIKGELRREIYRMLNVALERSGVKPEFLDRFEDRGDGVLVLIHPVDDVPKAHLLSRFVPEIAGLLGEYERGLPPAERASRGMRLRVVVHAGEIHDDGNGYYGEALDVACRLLDAPRLKRFLRETAGPLAVAVSEEIYWSVVRHEYDGISAAEYRPGLRVQVAGRRRHGWIHAPACASGRGPRVLGQAADRVIVVRDRAAGEVSPVSVLSGRVLPTHGPLVQGECPQVS